MTLHLVPVIRWTVPFLWLVGMATGCIAQAQEQAGDLRIMSDAPAVNWEQHAVPIGNGRLGAMVFGGTETARFQFNVDSLWTGDENPSGLYNEAGSGMGAYQNFGELIIELDDGVQGTAKTLVTCESDHTPFVGREGIASSVDGDPATKWCVEPNGEAIIWQADLGEARAVTGYTFTSANDVPARDPSAWVVAGSADGDSWTQLDRRTHQPAHQQRHEARDYAIEDPAEYRFVRITFTPNAGVSHFQLAEIALAGIDLGGAAGDRGETSGVPDDYRRSLDLRTAVHTTTWTGVDGTRYTRESFVSHPHEVIAIRMTAQGPSKLSGHVRLVGAHGETTATEPRTIGQQAAIHFRGSLPNDLSYQAAAFVYADGGDKIQVAPEGEDVLSFGDCQTLYIILAADTNYRMDRGENWRRRAPDIWRGLFNDAKVVELLEWDEFRAAHIADYQSLFNRVELSLAATDESLADRPIHARIASHKDDHDPALDALLFQFGRYLLISSSRNNGLPANLQGLWNNSNSPPWHADYHSNINMQMCYWLAEPANLAACHEPMFALLDATIPVAEEATRASFGADVPGFTFRTSHNIFGGQGWQWNIPASAWYAMHYWEHYAFSGDETFLREQAWPFFEGTCAFWLHELKELPDGTLVAPNGWSPEHGPREDGVAHDQQLIWDVFTNTLAAAEVLGIDNDFVDRIADARERLHGPEIGSWGQLMEWMVDRDDPDTRHRHTSHLVAVFPGHQISVTHTPDLAAAAAVSLRARGDTGDSRRSWTWAWRTALWARLRSAVDCHRMIDGLLEYNTLPNLLTTHPPFQIDGNLGITAGMCEMLLQSHAGEIDLLPAVDFERWPSGEVSGLRARGGFTVAVGWDHGQIAHASLHVTRSGVVRIRSASALRRLTDSEGNAVPFERAEDGAVRFDAEAGHEYALTF